MSLIRADEFGTYVLTGGYAFRPPVPSMIKAGEHVTARHRGGTQTAIVGNEIWDSYSSDPRYIEYMEKGSPGYNAKREQWRANPATAFVVTNADDLWNFYLRKKGVSA